MAHNMGRTRQLVVGQQPPGTDSASTLAAEIATEALLRSAARQAIISAAANALAELACAGGAGTLVTNPVLAINTVTTRAGGPIDGPNQGPDNPPDQPSGP